jgi:hypothetical protein
MKRRTLILAGVAALVAGPCAYGYIDLNLLKHGVHFVDREGHRYQVRPNSWVTRITGSAATTLGDDQIHLRWPRNGSPPPSSYLICHELEHFDQRRGSEVYTDPTPSPLFEIKHVVSKSFRERVESEAMNAGMAKRNDPHCVFVAKALAERVRVSE